MVLVFLFYVFVLGDVYVIWMGVLRLKEFLGFLWILIMFVIVIDFYIVGVEIFVGFKGVIDIGVSCFVS